MTDDRRHLTTDEDRARFAEATTRGGLCAGCGRDLSTDDVVYIEQIAIDLKPMTAPGAGWSRKTVYRDAPLGSECASSALLAQMHGQEPERCSACDRPVYYAKQRSGRRQALCSSRCSSRAKRGL